LIFISILWYNNFAVSGGKKNSTEKSEVFLLKFLTLNNLILLKQFNPPQASRQPVFSKWMKMIQNSHHFSFFTLQPACQFNRFRQWKAKRMIKRASGRRGSPEEASFS